VVARLEEAELELDALSGTAAEQVREYMRRWWAYLENPRVPNGLPPAARRAAPLPDLTQFYADEVIVRSHRLVSVLIARGVDGGEFRAVDIDVTARILAGMLITHSVWVCQQQIFKQPFTVSHEYLLGQLTDFFLHALRPDAGVADAGAPAAR
jgi:hypothetical protein